MTNVEDDPALLGRACGGQEPAVLHGVVAGAAVRVGQNVARPQQVEQIRQ